MTAASYLYRVPVLEHRHVNTPEAPSFLQLAVYVGCVSSLHSTRILDDLYAESKIATAFHVDQVLALLGALLRALSSLPTVL